MGENDLLQKKKKKKHTGVDHFVWTFCSKFVNLRACFVHYKLS